MKTAVIYARYSSNSQTEQSIEGQIHVCQEYAQKNDIAIIEHYIDRAMTGTNDNRPEFKRMIAESSNKKWDYVLVYKFDRFSRNQYEQVIHEHTLEKHGIKLLSATEPIPTESIGAFMKGMIISYNDYYSKELAEKVKRGLRETRAKGNFQGGAIIYGYKVENHKVIIDEERAEVVRYIYEQYSLGTYVKDIIKNLTQNGILNRGKPFARNTVYNILKNEKYSGIYRFKDEIFDNMFPQIIPTDLYEKVRRKIDLNKYGKRSENVVYIFKHKLKCGYCGMPISSDCGTTKQGKKMNYYKCLGRKRNNGCKKETIRKNILETAIIDSIIEEIKNPEKLKIIINNLMEVQNQLFKENKSLSKLILLKRKSETALDNIMTAIENGIMNNTTNKRMIALEKEIEDIDKQIIIEKSKTSEKISKEDLKMYLENAIKLKPEMLVNYLIKEITLFDDKIEIKFNTPIQKSPDEEQDFLFCRKFIYILKPISNILDSIRVKIGIDFYI